MLLEREHDPSDRAAVPLDGLEQALGLHGVRAGVRVDRSVDEQDGLIDVVGVGATRCVTADGAGDGGGSWYR